MQIHADINCIKAIRTGILAICSLFNFSEKAAAQDDHYWSQQYGATSTLMGGAMVGGVNDNSAIYYNPGALAFITHPGLSVDANVYRMDKILISDGAGNGLNLNSAQISLYPQILSGMINLFRTEKFKFSYTLLTRNHNNVIMNTRYSSKASQSDPDAPDPASTSFLGAYDYVNQLSELWFGIGSAYNVSEKLGIGVSLFTSYRGQTYQLTNYVQEVKYKDTYYVFGTKTNDEAIKYSTYSLIAKFGLSYITGNWKNGITITSPSVGLHGNGDIQREISNIVVSENPVDMAQNFMIADRKTDVKTSYKHPLSVAAGTDYTFGKTRLTFSSEYFFRIGTYHLLEPDTDPFVYPPAYLDSAAVQPYINSFLHVENAARPVFNASFGLSQLISKQITLLMGISTDFSSYEQVAEANELLHGFSIGDIYHFSGGLAYHKKKQSICLGFSYALTPSRHVPPYTVINQSPELTNTALLSSHSYTIVLGYTYYFARSE